MWSSPSRSAGGLPQLVALLALAVALPGAAQPAAVDGGPPPTGLMMVAARHEAREVGRWTGPVDFGGAEPVRFTARRRAGTWRWDEPPPGPVRLNAPNRAAGGELVTDWAEGAGADTVVVVIIPHPGAPDPGAGADGAGTSGQGTGADGAAGADARAATAAVAGATAGDAVGADAVAGAHAAGADAVGDGARGGLAVGQAPGLGAHASGTAEGIRAGSGAPSWRDNPRADLAAVGGHTPADGGRAGGSAAGEEGTSGHVPGGWFAVIDVPEDVAPAVAVAMIGLDADVVGFGGKLMHRAVRELAGAVLRKEIRGQAKSTAKGLLRRSRARIESAQPSPAAAQVDAAMAEMPEELERAYYEALARRAREQAEVYQGVLASRPAGDREVAAHVRQLATENRDAWQRIAAACDDELRALPPRPAAASPSAKAAKAPAEARLPWPPEPPAGPKPAYGEAGAAEWRYRRYVHEAYQEGKVESEILEYGDWQRRHFDPAANGGRPGRPGGEAHKADVKRNNGPDELRPKQVGDRYPDGVGDYGQTVTIRGQVIEPENGGRVIVEADHTIRNGTMPDSAARAQLRDIRQADPGATLVLTDVDHPDAAPLIYRPGTQPPPPGDLPLDQAPIVPYP